MDSEKRATVIKMQDKTVPTAELSLLIFLAWKNQDYISFISFDNFSDIRQIKHQLLHRGSNLQSSYIKRQLNAYTAFIF